MDDVNRFIFFLTLSLFSVTTARRCDGYSDEFKNKNNEQGILRALNCVCSDSFEEAGYTDSSFIGVTGVFTGLLAYTVFFWLCQLDLHEIKHIKRLFQAFGLFKTTMDLDIEGVKQSALCRIEGVLTAADIVKANKEKSFEVASAEAKSKFDDQLQKARMQTLKNLRGKDPKEVLDAAREADVGPRRLINSCFALYFLVCTFIALVDFYGNSDVSCGFIGSLHRFFALIYYKPFFLSAGSLILMVTTDLLFVTSELPENLSPLPDFLVFVIWWLILMPMMAMVFFPLVLEGFVLLLVFFPVNIGIICLSIALTTPLYIGFYGFQYIALWAPGGKAKAVENHLRAKFDNADMVLGLPGFLVMSQWALQGLFLAGQGLTCVFYVLRYSNCLSGSTARSMWNYMDRFSPTVVHDTNEMLQKFNEEYPLEKYAQMRDGWPSAVWLAEVVQQADKSAHSFSEYFNAGLALTFLRSLTTTASLKKKYKDSAPPYPPLMVFASSSFPLLFKVQIIGGYAILIWYVLALGQIFDPDARGRGYWQLGQDAFHHWGIGSLAFSFSWPEMPGFGKVSFALSFSGVALQYAIIFSIPFITRGFGIKELEKIVTGAATLTEQQAKRVARRTNKVAVLPL